MALRQVGRTVLLELLVLGQRQLHPERLPQLVLVHRRDVALLRERESGFVSGLFGGFTIDFVRAQHCSGAPACPWSPSRSRGGRCRTTA
eukprot:2315587-Prymnesium_polylepis.1